MEYTCKNCGVVASAPGHLCNPCEDNSGCSFCGNSVVEAGHMCKGKLADMKYVCDGCGRVAIDKDHLCKPLTIE